jgi:hypothetical protein
MKITNLISSIIVNYIRIGNKTELYQPTYNVKNLRLFRSDLEKRSSDDRVDVIQDNMPGIPGSYLDVGSQLGYFVFKMSEKGFLSCGIEANPVSCVYASNVANLNGVKNASFLNFPLDLSTVDSLPEYDVISILSVYHHMVYFFGKDDADIVLKKLIGKCRRRFFFETGEYEEKGFYWTDGLSFMGEDSSMGITKFLEEFGFSSITKIGEHATHLTDHKRSLFMCEK